MAGGRFLVGDRTALRSSGPPHPWRMQKNQRRSPPWGRRALMQVNIRTMSKVLKERVLVVDDEPDLLELIEVNLKAAGYDVLSATNGKDALQIAREKSPALIVLDVMLPELDGLEVCKSLRRDAATGGIPILILTARVAEI